MPRPPSPRPPLRPLGRPRAGLTGTLARRSATHPWVTVGAWVVLLALAIVSAAGLGDVLTQDGELLVETDAQRADDLIETAFAGADEPATEFVVVESAAPGITADPALATLAAELQALDDVDTVVGPHLGAPQMASADDTTALLQVTYVDADPDAVDRRAEALVELLADHDGALAVSAIGEGSVTHEFNELAESNLRQAELFGLPAALVILVLVFGAVAAAFVPIVLAIVAIAGAVGLTALVGQVTDLSFFVVNMITMIGLAVGIDYTLFVVQRYREERAAGRETIDAIGVAGATASRAVLFSGVTVVIALLGMLLVPDTIMRSLGIGAILVVAAAVAAGLTLLPAVLALMGDKVDALRLPWVRRRAGAVDHRFWNRVTAVVTARPVVSMLVAGGLLVALAVPYATIELGQNGIASLPEGSSARHAFEVMNAEFSGGAVETPIVVTGDDVADPAVQGAVEDLVARLEADEIFGDVTVSPSPGGELLLVEAATLIDPATTEGMDHIRELRDETIPAVFAGVPAEALITGQAAWTLDYNEVVTGRTPWVFAFVLGLSFLLLLVAFRSVVVPLKAIVMNLLSVGAAYGLLVGVFQHGWGAELLGFQQVDVIETWIPVFLFAVLFGLSMDYHVFLLSRIKERFDVTRDNSASVAFGLGATGAIITGAALIMVAVFAGFAAGDLVMMQQMGFGLGVAVILDATIVRSVLVPATMELLGDRNWYFPAWLEWVPRINVEGHVDPVEIDLTEEPAPVVV
ncbi:MMPL family transporter [Euzebya sp.]|uniref:MMPL family transporter n=1 Tax=Euzebya sp. TaxID=1971409 RepID=UPI003515C30F